MFGIFNQNDNFSENSVSLNFLHLRPLNLLRKILKYIIVGKN